MPRLRLSLGLSVTLIMGSAVGCTFITSVDRDKIPHGDVGEEEAGSDAGADGGGAGGAPSEAGTGGEAPIDGSTGGGDGSAEAGEVCTTADDCDGVDTQCSTHVCTNNRCSVEVETEGTATDAQVEGDCKRDECDGAGNVRTVNDSSDADDDGLECTVDACDGGNPTHTPAAEDTACGTGANTKCDGAGTCVGCTRADQCPAGDECRTATCMSSTCGFDFRAAQTATATQADGDCKRRECDGSGGNADVVDAADTPDDGNACTDDLCSGTGDPSNPNSLSGAQCATGGGKVCDGSGACVACVTAADCPGAITDCARPVCTGNHTCDVAFEGDGTAVSEQTAGDCKRVVCDGSGSTRTAADAADNDDGNPCTDDSCNGTTPVHADAAPGTSCGANVTCTSGECTGCAAPADCPGVDNACQQRTCSSGTCGFDREADGTVTASQTVGDCKRNECDGNGNVVEVNDGTDVSDDDNDCTNDVCSAGSSSHQPKNPGATCSSGGSVCDGSGDCVECNVPADCPGSNTECSTRTCSVAHACGVSNEASGTILLSQTSGDCKQAECDGSGNVVQVNENSDVANDDKQCTTDTCNAGTPVHTPKAAGTTCTENGGALCNATGVCQPPACDDGVKNGDETDVDCGDACPNCDVGKTCAIPADCTSNVCTQTECLASVANEDGDDPEADTCSIASAATFSVGAGDTTPAVLGLLLEASVTEAAGAPANVVVQVGYGADGTDPRTTAGWKYVDAAYDSQVGNEDQFTATFTAPAAGTYSFVVRVSFDGVKFTYCDNNGAGSANGKNFSVADLGTMTVTP